jgi:hypothetical protein
MADLMGRGLRATFTQADTPPASGVLVTVPTSVRLYRTVYGSATLTDSGTMLIEVETGVATGAYATAGTFAATAAVDTYSTGYSFLVASGCRYRFTMVGDAVITAYSYGDT